MKNSYLPRVVLLLACLLSFARIAHTSHVAGKEEDPLEVSDLVVQGVVQKVSPGEFSYPTQPPDSLRFGSMNVSLKVSKVLRGNWSGAVLTLVSLHDPQGFIPGRKYIICASWYPVKQAYVTTPFMGTYSQEGKHWVRRTAAYDIKPETLTQADLDTRVGRGSLNSITRRADVVVIGQITAATDSVYPTTVGWHGRIRHFTARIDQVLKGRANGPQLEFIVPKTWDTSLGWKETPEITVGETWLLFLKSSDLGLYPFAGRNSLLRVDGDDLVFNAKVILPRSQVLQRVREEVRIENKN